MRDYKEFLEGGRRQGEFAKHKTEFCLHSDTGKADAKQAKGWEVLFEHRAADR